MLSTGATLGQDSVARQVANPGAHCTTRAVLGCAYGAPACLCCAVGMQCDPRSLGNSPFASVSARLQVAFYEEVLGSQFPSPPCLRKGPPFPNCPSASLELERSSARLTPSTGDPSAPSQLHPTRAKALWAHDARIGQSSSAVQLPAATAVGIASAPTHKDLPQKSPTWKAHPQQHAVEVCRQEPIRGRSRSGRERPTRHSSDEVWPHAMGWKRAAG